MNLHAIYRQRNKPISDEIFLTAISFGIMPRWILTLPSILPIQNASQLTTLLSGKTDPFLSFLLPRYFDASTSVAHIARFSITPGQTIQVRMSQISFYSFPCCIHRRTKTELSNSAEIQHSWKISSTSGLGNRINSPYQLPSKIGFARIRVFDAQNFFILFGR